MGLLPRLSALLLGVLLAAPSGAVPSSLDARMDPRLELLGVVQYLAGRHRAVPGEDAAALEARFGRFRGEPAVKTYAETAARLKDGETYGLISLFLTDPPELKWARDPALLSGSFLENAGGRAKLENFLEQLRRFAAASGFAGYYAGLEPERRRVERAAAAELSRRDFVGAVEGYAGGNGLDSRVRLILCALYSPEKFNEYIIPYPFAGPGLPARTGPFDVFSLIAARSIKDGTPSFGLDEASLGGAWNELMYVFLEPSFAAAGGKVDAYRGLHRAVAPECFETWNQCAEHLIVQAVRSRIERKLSAEEARWPSGALGVYEAALSARLAEYEAHRDRYPSFGAFFPRIIDVFRELSLKQAPASAVR